MKKENFIQKSIFLTALLFICGTSMSQTNPPASANFTFNSIDFGTIKPGKTTQLLAGKDFDVEGYGRMFCHHISSDEGRFVYTKLTGDFDVTVRVENIHNDTAALSEVGIMARQSLDPTSILMSMAVTNNEYKGEGWPYTFMYRIVPEGFAGKDKRYSKNGTHGEKTYGNFAFGCSDINFVNDNLSLVPRPIPHVWVRLTKVGDRFAGYRKEKNEDWVKLGDYTLNMGEELYVGLFISANHHGGTANNKTEVKFRDLKILQ